MSDPALALSPHADLRTLVRGLVLETPADLDLEDALDPRHIEAALVEPAYDILRRDGKRFRSRLVEHCWRVCGGEGDLPAELPLIVELLHAGSLVIDDIEDDSQTRRGEPSLHRRFGVPLALNTGNWLYFLPITLLSRLEVPDATKLALHGELAQAVILCHQGQALDLSARVTSLPMSEMPNLVRHSTQLKTGSLMRLSAVLGAYAAGAAAELAQPLAHFGAKLGLGLQMLDDWSGIRVEERRHKGIEDIKLQRPTWPWAWLAMRNNEIRYAQLVEETGRIKIDWEAEGLLLRMRSQLEEDAPRLIHEHLAESFESLKEAVGPSEALEELRSEVTRLEEAFG